MDYDLTPYINYRQYFDQIYLVNLKRRPDRLESFFIKNKEIFSKNDIKVFEAVDGKAIIKNIDWSYSKGALGCRLSHLKILKDAEEKKFSRILIIEDDAIIKKNFNSKLKYLLKTINYDWDMIYFGGTHNLPPIQIDKNITRITRTLTTHCYAVNYRCIAELIQKIETDKRWVDCAIADLHSSLLVYGFSDNVATQQKGYSDILEEVVDYNTPFFVKIKRKIRKIIKKIVVRLNIYNS
ncbi:glycosyltransferase family 25 protein [Pedobacter sp. Leaf250]|uniref:glycosyltransferase family 25 protein n=1 Tax=Pedobacter sp. Leaf250 TaxID=2876559 RepID=UPI001E65508D|nr:glycosyltransferase family 25 protein [Pedobacter sp. Leaf250]